MQGFGEKHSGLEKERNINRYRWSQIAVYFKDGKKVTVHNSYYVGAVYIQSEFDLTTFFTTKERGDK